MTTLFISDLHLCEQRPDLTATLLAFLQQQATKAEALYILGDLFEQFHPLVVFDPFRFHRGNGFAAREELLLRYHRARIVEGRFEYGNHVERVRGRLRVE